MNQVLRAQMEGKGAISAGALADDERFIQAVAQRVKVLSSKKQRKSA